MLPPDFYLQARQSARFHLQVQVTAVRLPLTFPGDATIEATVRTIFRGAETMSAGVCLEFAVSTCNGNEALPAGPVIWISAECLAEGRWLAVCRSMRRWTEIERGCGQRMAPTTLYFSKTLYSTKVTARRRREAGHSRSRSNPDAYSDRLLEVFLNKDSRTCSVAASQVLPIDGPTDAPKMSLSEM